jgi:type IV pilus assembly protein PilX
MNPSKQKGMVLLVSLILLLMLTLIAITASNQATLQLRISSNSEQRTMAFQAAEGGIANWIGSYFQIPLEKLKTISEVDANPLDSAISVNLTPDTKSLLDVKNSSVRPCSLGSGMGPGQGRELYCFDLVVEGESACEDGVCAVKTVHHQGGLRAGSIQ